MTYLRTLVACTIGVALFGQGVAGEGLGRYRDFELGMNVGAVTALTGSAAGDVKTIHQRPAVLQDLMWRLPQWVPGSMNITTDPVEQIGFSFYNDQLFRVVVDYEHNRTEGMTDEDLIDAIAVVYGPPLKRTAAPVRVASQIEAESGTAVARWRDADVTVALYRTTSYRGAFRLIVTKPSLDSLVQKATAQALRLDDQEAPRREVARAQKEKDDGRAAAEKARIANKAVFRP